MTEEQEHPIHPYSVDELNAALQHIITKYPNVGCPVCGTVRWKFEAHGLGLLSQPRPAFVMLDPSAYFGPAPSIPVLNFTCVECGFIRQHSLPQILGR